MATSPATPNPPRRSVTSPALPQPREQRSSPDRSGDSLYSHPGATIFNFRPSPALLTSSNNADLNLPWATRFEKVAASGSLRLYKLNGFNGTWLKSGKLILNLFPRTQCWCVDGKSKFAVRLQQTIYRIELPCDTEDELAKVEEFKEALSKVLFYERTACPFDREFTVDLPEDAELPQTPRGMQGPKTKARRWEFDEGWRPEGEERERPPTARSERSNPSSSDNESRSSVTTEETRARKFSMPSDVKDDTKPPIRPRPMDMRRNFTAPQPAPSKPDDPFVSAPPSAARAAAGIVETRRMSFNGDGAVSNVSTHRPRTPRARASHTPSPPSSAPSLEPESPITPHNSSGQPAKPTIHNGDDVTDTPTATPSPQPAVDKLTTTTAIQPKDSSLSPSPSSPQPRRSSYSTSRINSILPHPLDPSSSSKSSAVTSNTQPTSTLRPRPQAPLTHRTSARLLRTTSNRASDTASDTSTTLPRGILTKTIALLLSPPSSLIEFLVQIAERFARSATEWGGGAAYRVHEPGTGTGWAPLVVPIPGGWEDDSDFEVLDMDRNVDGQSRLEESQKERGHRSRPSEDEYGGPGVDGMDDEDLDDFGVPLGVDTPAKSQRREWGRGGVDGAMAREREEGFSGDEAFGA